MMPHFKAFALYQCELHFSIPGVDRYPEYFLFELNACTIPIEGHDFYAPTLEQEYNLGVRVHYALNSFPALVGNRPGIAVPH
jgi:hypothetical protein